MALLDLRWHLRAWRAQARWEHTRESIRQWLLQAPDTFDDLLLFGASAGWMMPDDFLARFRRIDAIDFEWAASPLFRLRHRRVIAQGRIEVNFHRAEALSNLEQFLALRPRALVLFDNVLGQYTLTCRNIPAAEAALSALKTRLAARSWGSVHDALSGSGRRMNDRHPQVMHLAPGQAWPEHPMLDQVGATGSWGDHLTREVLPATVPSRLIAWQLTPGYWHWLQAGWVIQDASDRSS